MQQHVLVFGQVWLRQIGAVILSLFDGVEAFLGVSQLGHFCLRIEALEEIPQASKAGWQDDVFWAGGVAAGPGNDRCERQPENIIGKLHELQLGIVDIDGKHCFSIMRVQHAYRIIV